jgi:hypothetical protein
VLVLYGYILQDFYKKEHCIVRNPLVKEAGKRLWQDNIKRKKLANILLQTLFGNDILILLTFDK